MSTVVMVCAAVACLLIVGVGVGLQYTGIVVAQQTLTVDIPGQGKVRGALEQTLWTNENYWKFLSIPYAESPKGELRFKAPVPRSPWTKEHDGTKFGLRCPVITTISQMSEQERHAVDIEDCLNLCVYTKSLTAKQPVMFYIYGGGFYNGSASDHPPRHLLAQHQDIVLVVAQYRVGAIGWLTTYTEEMPGNVPMADLVLALKWVQNNIENFGGDPKRVTIVGQSAGAIMSGALLLSPSTADQRLFRAALIQSGSILSAWSIKNEPIKQAQRICNALKCDDCTSNVGLYACLQKADVLDILQVTTTDKEDFRPVVGDLLNLLPQQPKNLLARFELPIPVMTGFTKHDGSFALALFYDTMKSTAGGNFSNISVRQFSEHLITQVAFDNGLSNNLFLRLLFDGTSNLLNSVDHKRAIPAYFDIVNIGGFKSDTINLAKTLALKKLANVFVYTFDYDGANTRFGYEMGNEQYPFEGGVHHSNDNIYVFSTHELNEADTEMAKKVVALWTSFVINGIPQGLSDDPIISPMSSEIAPYFHINSNITIGTDIMEELTATIDDPENYKLQRANVEF